MIITKIQEFFNDMAESVRDAEGNRTLNWIALITVLITCMSVCLFIVWAIFMMLNATFFTILVIIVFIGWAFHRLINKFN